MRIAVHTLGTRGDVQPYLALAGELAARGHSVSIAGPAQFEAFVAGHGIRFHALPGEFLALLDSAEGKAAMAGGNGFSAGFKLLGRFRPLMRKLLDAEADHARAFKPEVIVHHPKSMAGPHLAELLGCPALLASPLPGFTPTSAFPSPMLPFASLGPLNRASHLLAIKGPDMLFGKTLRRWRAETLGLPSSGKTTRFRAGTLYAYSAHVLPKPADWGDDVCVSGYWFMDEGDYAPPADLARFLADGEAPIYVGFGSIPGLDPEGTAQAFVDALVSTGRRGLIATVGGALGRVDAPASIHFMEGAPHDWLFPRMHAVIHHGGAGTTGAALRAGKPMAICPFFGDQPFWARTIERLGVGPAALDRKRGTAEALSQALATLDDPETRDRAAKIGAAIRAERGPAVAADFIEQRVAAWAARHR
jgi:sterol 3beta-glucosyltransferase